MGWVYTKQLFTLVQSLNLKKKRRLEDQINRQLVGVNLELEHPTSAYWLTDKVAGKWRSYPTADGCIITVKACDPAPNSFIHI
jgi:hypothetical protein